MEKIKSFKGRLNDCLTNDFRELVERKLGKLSTPESFMYLYRRFGVPNYDNKDEYKILYDYRFKHKDIFISVHASYHEYVYFNLFFPQKYLSQFNHNRKSIIKRLIKEALNRNTPFALDPFFMYKRQDYFTKKQNEKNWKLIDLQAQKYFGKDYGYIDAQFNSKKPEEKALTMLDQFTECLAKHYRSTLSKSDLKELTHWPKLTDVPEIRKMALSAIQQFKKGVYIRDVAINIKGYESPENKIYKFI